MCQYEHIKATVGDVLVFKKDAADDDVFAVPSQWHYAQCNFSDGGAPLRYDSSSSASEIRYTILPGDKNQRLYLASSRDSACMNGQRVLVSVDDFKQGTLAEAIELVEQEVYKTEAGAVHLIERIWCFEDHCPTPALGFYEGNLNWAKARCRADAFSLLGFVYRKRPQPQIKRAREYYEKALALVPEHCEATGYLGELFLQIQDFEEASATFLRLQALAESEKTGACEQSVQTLRNAWVETGWCPPPVNSRSSCEAQDTAVVSAGNRLATSASVMSGMSALLVVLVGFVSTLA